MENQFIRFNISGNSIVLEKEKVLNLKDLVSYEDTKLRIKLKDDSEIIGTIHGFVLFNPIYIDVDFPFNINIKTSDNCIVSFTAPEFQSFEIEKY